MTMWAYLQVRLVGDSRVAAVSAELEELAASYGGSVRGNVFRESGSAVGVLWGLVEELNLTDQIQGLAQRKHLDLRRVIGSPPSTPALWSLLGKLDGARGGYLFVPSPAHFGGFGVPEAVVLRRITAIRPAVSVIYLDPTPTAPRPRQARTGWLGEWRVDANGIAVTIAQHSARHRLSRAGLGDLVDPVSILLGELVGDAVKAAAADPTAPPNTLTIRLSADTSLLVVEIDETRHHASQPVSEAVQAICAVRPGGDFTRCSHPRGTLTRCALPLPVAETATTTEPTDVSRIELADALQRWRELRSEP
ncbi:hypothetical protein [Nocardia sp. NPDC052566]|uniref:hypothetical protein n=1 Tax=Nocardia sp. NPDC052566 TaxID=3364330 RepID=UPI0037CBB56E